jgi:broad specificity phosphatase PhoE
LHKLIYDGDHKEKYIKKDSWNELALEEPLPFPENYVMFHERIGRYKDKLVFPPEGQCTLVITHGFVVR